MARLPNPGSDDNVWGGVLNDFLQVEHNGDGSLKKADAITQAQADASNALAIAQDRDAAKLQGVQVAAAAPNDGQVLVYSQADDEWVPTSTGTGARVFVQGTDPGGAAQDGDIWIDTST